MNIIPRFEQENWMLFAKTELGVEAYPGAFSSARVGEYLKIVNLNPDDDIAWCSAFVNWVMKQAGYPITGSGLARSWLTWGIPLFVPQYGAITIFRRGKSPTSGHVAFFLRKRGNTILVLGGNQSNQVKVSEYSESDWLGYRWPWILDYGTP